LARSYPARRALFAFSDTSNEELESTVEELETTNEELQSTNDELQSLDEQFRHSNAELDATGTAGRRTTPGMRQALATQSTSNRAIGVRPPPFRPAVAGQ
jgi:chromosome segregation ATPase